MVGGGRTVGTRGRAEGEGSRETYHNDVLMLLGSQVCVLKGSNGERRRETKQNKNTDVNKMEHLYLEGPTSGKKRFQHLRQSAVVTSLN